MLYTDNPRKVYAKLKIVYSDSEISKELMVVSSGNGSISAPTQTYKGYVAPTIKACTMDGNSTMGGGYQMNGVGLVTGWWSDVHCGGSGEFIEPPWLETSFISRPVISWTIIGDSKLNQYPVDFTITAYKGNTAYSITEVTNNREIHKQIRFEDALPDITKIRITIKKWSTKNAKAKLLQFFDILEEEYDGEDILNFEVQEELSGGSDGVNYGINSDTATFTLYNKERKFDKGYLRALLLLNRKVTPYIGIEAETGAIEYTKLGTFYSDEWTVPQTDQTVKLKCVDKLMSLQLSTYIGYPYTDGTNLFDIAEDILTKAGFHEKQFSIDESLKQDVLQSGYLRKSSCWDALQEVCTGGLCYAYCDRDDRIVIAKDKALSTDMRILPESITHYEKKTTMTDFSNYIQVDYNEVTTSNELVTVSETVITVGAGEEITMLVDYSADISDAAISFMPSSGIELKSFESGVNAGKFEIRNNNANVVILTATVKGYAISISSQTAVTQDIDSILQWGKQEYKYSGSELIQSYAKAVEYGEKILALLSQGNGVLSLTWRGDPKLKLQDEFYAEDRFGDGEKYVAVYNLFKFDGGLKQETKGRQVNDGLERT